MMEEGSTTKRKSVNLL